MRRADRARDAAFCEKWMDRCSHGVVAVNDAAGAPYCLPLSLVRVGRSLYFHCAREGRKVQLLRADPRVCVSFVGADEPAFVEPGEYTTYFASVIVTGTAREVTDEAEKIRALRALCEKLTPGDMAGFETALRRSLAVTAVWRIDLDEPSGKAKQRKA